MGRRKTMPELRDIIHRLRLGQSKRTIHKETGTHRTIVRQLEKIASEQGWLNAPEMPQESEISKIKDLTVKRSPHPLDPHREYLKELVDREISFVVIHRLIQQKHKCDESTVRRYIKKHLTEPKAPTIRRIAEPGHMEVDFGYLCHAMDDRTGKVVKAKVFSGRLRYSRKAYRRVVNTERQELFFQCHMEAFRYFGGVPTKVIPDNLKAAVIRASIDDPMINRAYRSLAEHYGFTISPCLPRRPEHKGGVENDIKYIKSNFLPEFKERLRQQGRELPLLSEIQKALDQWNDEVADARIIRDEGRTPCELFEYEKGTLADLPVVEWDRPVWKQCRVARDYRIQFENAYYSVPYKFIGKDVLVCGTFETVRIFLDFQEIASHRRAERKFQFVSSPQHTPPNAEAYLEMTRPGLLKKAALMGEEVRRVAESIFEDRAVDGIRPVRGLFSLAKKYGKVRLRRACQRALCYHTASYQSVKSILEKNLDITDEIRERTEPYLPHKAFRYAREANYFNTSEKGDQYERTCDAQTEIDPAQAIGNS